MEWIPDVEKGKKEKMNLGTGGEVLTTKKSRTAVESKVIIIICC